MFPYKLQIINFGFVFDQIRPYVDYGCISEEEPWINLPKPPVAEFVFF